MAEPGVPMRLKEWLIAQIDSGRYPGLRWENRHRTLFRIPWKHAAKQDYRQQQDAALFKAWAVYKGKYHEGTDKADPSTWKTRLRCALNKSTDFQEVPERSQLDISEPYKVYQIVSDGARDTEKDGDTRSPAGEDRRRCGGSGGRGEPEGHDGDGPRVSAAPAPCPPGRARVQREGSLLQLEPDPWPPPPRTPVLPPRGGCQPLRLLAPRPPLLLRRAGEGGHHPHGRGLPHHLPRRAGRQRAPLRPLLHGADRVPPAAGAGRRWPGGRHDRRAGEAPAPPGARGAAVGSARGGLHEAAVPGQGVLERATGPAQGLAQQAGEGEDLQAAGHAAVPAAAAWVPEPRAAHAAVPDPPVFRGGVPHRRRAPLPEAYHGPCGAGVRAGALPSRPARGPDAAAPAPPALHPRRLQPRHPRPQTALPALRPRRDEASQQDALAAPRPRSGHLPRGRGWGAGCHPRTDLYLFPRSPPGWGLLCAWPLSRLHPRALHRRGLASREPWK
ncbi:trithorax group protein osa-like isoform X2 [Tyto alba]|uniref:trithorax group protein osa-like isoform X2 n=1 Tax=Tyto alba TaxID=56313 RepID=UPI001C681A92|nr:trithorax group protein osa-like isoform X2 [Tyto alba]